ncbi:TonB-dependent receptor [Hymenobacter volaticus]|uniref:Carboxypeptidase-like regulatory domain-containing protein n=1 Tax=Hymenobacter volaticus TaxID=2932254 RepID=A0ABY4GDN2_9BACT|nr:carboxypeptidase-like regulatory domain-containing protein [Hymenobacter volaticus]UOQ69021.1 carboxypeptidase-like regulatory domain-containing protein [Hymenobacter volaticus]
MNSNSTFYALVFTFLLLSVGAWAQQQTLSGRVQNEAGQALPGVTVFLKGTYIGGSTDEDGRFELRDAKPGNAPSVLVVSLVGYESQELPLASFSAAAPIVLKPSTMLDQVVVAASRVEEAIGQVPVTVEKLDQRQVQQLTSPDLVAGLGRFKSIDISSSSMLTTSFSTRGFNSSRADRVIQLADYVDTAAPSLSSNFGNLLGIPVLDVASVEIVHGPASALYGANAFNGVLLTNSRDPFRDPGLSVRLRAGNRHLLDGQLRYAVKLGERVAFKIAGGYIQAHDFTANNQDATSQLIEPANNPVGSNLGYDAVSRYGDIGNTFTATGGALAGKTVFLPGYSEADLIGGDNKTYSLKVAPSLSVLLTDRVKATVGYKYNITSSTYQAGARYRFENSGVQQAKVLLEGRNWFVRAFTTRDFSGGRDPQTDGSYNLGFLGAFLQTQLAPGFNVPIGGGNSRPGSYAERYFGTYASVYNQAFAANGGNADAAALTARTAANTNAPLLQPGTPEFAAARDQIIHDPTPGVGARLIIRSLLNDGSAQYNFKSDVVDVVVGGSYRQYLLGSDGSLFQDSREGDRIENYEYGAYARASKGLVNERLQLAAATRVDRFKNFGTAFSPRFSAVYSAGPEKQHNLRASFSRALRAPAQDNQYIRLDVGRAILLGNVENGYRGYTTTLATQLPGILAPTRAADLATYEYQANPLKLEEVNSAEVGYRAQLTPQLFLDVDYFYSVYDNFIAIQNSISNVDGTRPTAQQIAAAAPSRFQSPANPTRVIQIAANVDQQVRTNGAGLSVNYTFSRAWS